MAVETDADMCGLCGIHALAAPAPDERAEHEAALEHMSASLRRRGPDDDGRWTSEDGRTALAFRRLSVLDVSDRAHQPMVSPDGRSVLAFNGEITNYRELATELASHGVRFRSTGDTEVLLHALERWGADALARLDGMFALAWVQPESRRLLLARDRCGIKPLWVSTAPDGRTVAFASQLDTVLRAPWGVPGPLRTDVLGLQLRLGYIPAPYGLFEGVEQLEPGTFLEITPSGRRVERWWSLPRHPEADLGGTEAVDVVGAALSASVERQLRSDVPLGVFLSGGIDSPLVASEARSQVAGALSAFTVGTPGWAQDEEAPATAIAGHLGLDGHVLRIADEQLEDAVEDVIRAQHEPFSDFSLLPTLLLSRLARTHVTVALSGDGGDELFFGYERPVALIHGAAEFRHPPWLRRMRYLMGRLGVGPRRSDVGQHADPGAYYRAVHARFDDATLAHVAPGLPSPPTDFTLYAFDGPPTPRNLADFSRRVEFTGQLQRGLKKVDMASMHESLEVRVPLLGNDVLEASLRVDPLEPLARGLRKDVLRTLLERRVPEAMLSRRKLGFAVPLGRMLSGPLAPRVEDTLSGPLYPTGFWDRARVRTLWQEHRSGVRDHKWRLWTILCLAWWHRRMQADGIHV